jgi:flavin reductase (DIM6/NTAB) family NADH-FMN oxidoreductase RutF
MSPRLRHNDQRDLMPLETATSKHRSAKHRQSTMNAVHNLNVASNDTDAAAFRHAMRELASGVSVIAAGRDDEWTGITATSVSSLSLEPPTILVCVNRSSSLAPFLQRYWHFSVNVLSSSQREIANRFAGRGGIQGRDRFLSGRWQTLVTGAPVLVDALTSIDCKLEEIIERHSHLIVLGHPLAIRTAGASDALLHWRGEFARFPAQSFRPS